MFRWPHRMLTHPRIYLRNRSLARKFGTTFANRTAALRTLNCLESATRTWSSDEELTVDILGHPMRGFDPWAMKLLFHEVFLGHEYRFMSDVPDPVIIDCGANIGFSVLYFKRLYAAAHIHAFEPHPDAFRLLQRNVESNGLDHVHARRAALSDHDGEAAFYTHKNRGRLVNSLRASRGGPQRVIVETQRLSTLLTTLDRVDVVKMDVEGAEWDILADLCATGTLGRTSRYIIEYHHQVPGDSPRLPEFLRPFEEAGFRYQVGSSIGDPAEFQDILIHFVRGPGDRASSSRSSIRR